MFVIYQHFSELRGKISRMETFENTITLGDLKMTVENPQLNGFMQFHHMSYLINEPTYFQPHDPICLTKF